MNPETSEEYAVRMEERFLFMYHLHVDPEGAVAISQEDRQYLINLLVEQKKRENDAMEDARRRSRMKRREYV